MMEKRKHLYGNERVDGVKELDYLQTPLLQMELDVSREFTVRSTTQFRPDLISKIVFQSYHYGWLIMEYNNILDPFTELTQGTVLEIPNIEQYFEFFNDNSRISRDD